MCPLRSVSIVATALCLWLRAIVVWLLITVAARLVVSLIMIIWVVLAILLPTVCLVVTLVRPNVVSTASGSGK